MNKVSMSGNLFKKSEFKPGPIEAGLAVEVQNEIIRKLKARCSNEVIPIGSVGHKNTPSGDIDIAVKIGSVEELEELVKSTFGVEMYVSKTISVVSMNYPYLDNGVEKRVSVDFMQVLSIPYTRFRYYCPDYTRGESKYKVGTKIMFAGSIISICCASEMLGLDKDCRIETEFNADALWVNYYYKTGVADEYIWKREMLSMDPVEIAGLLFKDSDPARFNSVETLWESVHSGAFKYPSELKFIERSLFVNSYRKGWEEQVKPEDFKCDYWTLDEMNEELKKVATLRGINMNHEKFLH